MRIGFMTNFNKPTELAKITSLISKAYNIEVVYLRPKDVLIEEDKVNGRVFVNNQWKTKKIDIPPFIDVVPYCFTKQNREIMNYLKGKTILSDNRTNVLTKIKLQELLREDKDFSHLIIPTHHANQFEDLIQCIEEYSTIVLKPLSGIRGRGVYVVSKQEDKYTIGFKMTEKVMDQNQLHNFFHDEIQGNRYIIQKYVQSRTIYGEDPFDCRIHVEKGIDGKWTTAKKYIRIGIGQKVISNVNQGGGIGNPKYFLKANFGERWKEVHDKLDQIAVTLPYKMEALRGTHIMSLGMDLGIDRDGEIYLFEVNDGPDTSSLISDVAFLRSNYYLYLLKQFKNKEKPVKMNKSKNTQINKELLKEKNYYQKRYNLIANSTSWKITKPIRLVGNLLKSKR